MYRRLVIGSSRSGHIVTWRLDSRLPQVGILATLSSGKTTVIHNIGIGAEETPLAAFHPHRAAGHFRWPATA